MTRKELQELIREEYKNHIIEEGMLSWLVDKVANAATWLADKNAQYNYEALLNSKEFRQLASKYNMKEDEFVRKAKEMVKRDPKKFADMLNYDPTKSKYIKYMR